MIIKPEREITELRSQRVSPFAEPWPQLAHRELVNRIVASAPFVRSERLSTLLTYVCDMALKGRENELHEQKIGHAVFGRVPDYDSAVDGIVRTQASRLRQRLDQYFQMEGAHEPVRVTIPRGGYVPVFETVTAKPHPLEVQTATQPLSGQVSAILPEQAALSANPAIERVLPWWLPWALCGMLTVMLVALVVHSQRGRQPQAAGVPITHPLWSHIFSAGRPTLLVAADSGLVMYNNVTGTPIGLNDYLEGNYRAEPPGGFHVGADSPPKDWTRNFANRRYTSVVDVDIIATLLHRAPQYGSELKVQYARDLRPNDLKTGNAILLGATEANPWVELFERNMNFVFKNNYRTNVFSVINRSPVNGEPRQWDSADADRQRRVYGLVAYVPNLSQDGNMLILEGTSMSGTEAAWDFVSDDAQLSPFLKRLQRPDGSIPHFELLLGTQNMSASAVQTQVIAWRTSN